MDWLRKSVRALWIYGDLYGCEVAGLTFGSFMCMYCAGPKGVLPPILFIGGLMVGSLLGWCKKWIFAVVMGVYSALWMTFFWGLILGFSPKGPGILATMWMMFTAGLYAWLGLITGASVLRGYSLTKEKFFGIPPRIGGSEDY